MVKTKFNIGISEFEEAVKFAKENNKEVITFEYETNPIGNIFRVSKDWNDEQKDITDYDKW